MKMSHLRIVLLAVVAASALGAQESRVDVKFRVESRPFNVDLRATPWTALRSFNVDWPTLRLARTIPFELRTRFGDDTAWLSLDQWAPPPRESRPKDDMASPLSSDDVGFRERWLMKSLKERVKGLTAADTVERLVVRHDGQTRTVTSERGIEVRGPAEALTQARELFDRFTAGSKKTVTIEVRVVELEEGRGRTDGTSAAVVKTRQEFEERVKALMARGAGNVVYSPTVKVSADHTATVSVVDQTSYIKDYNIEVVGESKIADPVIGLIHDGFEMELTPLFDPDGSLLVVGGVIRLSRLERPMEEHRVQVGNAQVTIQLPSVWSHKWSGEVKLASGEDTFMISGLKDGPGKGPVRNVEVWCLVTVEDEAAALPAGEIVNRSDETIFVSFPREYVPGDPWDKAPKEVTVYRKGEKIGTARLAGGWVMPTEPDPKRTVIAIYQLTEGTPRDGDTVR